MRIAYCGNFKPTHSTETHLARTLEMLGHQVVRIQEDEVSPDMVFYLAYPCDLFLFTRTWGNTVTLQTLDKLREKKVPTASYHLDLYIGLKRDGGLGDDPFWRTDFVFTPDGGHENEFRNLGINHFYMKPGVFETECYIAPPLYG